MAASLAFYERAFGFKAKFLAEGGNYGELEVDGHVSLGFVSNHQARQNLAAGYVENNAASRPAGFEVAFVVEDVEAAFQTALEAGAGMAAPPARKPWGQVVAYVRDIDGVLVELCSPMHH